jgi:hypothetical protein
MRENREAYRRAVVGYDCDPGAGAACDRMWLISRAGAALAPAERVTYIGVPANSVYLTVAPPVI